MSLLGAGGGNFLPPVVLEVVANIDRLKAGVNGAVGEMNRLEGEGIKGMQRFGAAVKIGMAIAATAIVKSLGDAVKAASDMGETLNKVSVLFGESQQTIIDWAETASTSFGQSKQQALDAATTFAGFGQASGLTGQSLINFSEKLTVLASDLASFHNTSPQDAIYALGAALRGESEPIRRYQVMLNDATLKAKAMEMGIYSGTGILSQQAKTLAAYNVILDQTKVAQGDFANTSDGLANSQRTMQAVMADLQIEVGNVLLPFVTDLATGFKGLLYWMKEHSGFVKGVAIGVVAALTTALIGLAIANIAAMWEIYLAVAAIGAYVAALIWAWNNVEGFREGLIKIAQTGVPLFLQGLKLLIEATQLLATALDMLLGGFAAVARAAGDTDLANTLDGWGDSIRGASSGMDAWKDKLTEWSDFVKSDKFAKNLNNLKIGFDFKGMAGKLASEVSGAIDTSGIDFTGGAAGAKGAKGMKTAFKSLAEDINKFRDAWTVAQVKARGNLDEMEKVANTALQEARNLKAAAIEQEQKTRGTKNHAIALTELARTTRLVAEAQKYQNDVYRQMTNAAIEAARAVNFLTDSYQRNQSYLAAVNRVSGFEQAATYIEVPVIVDGQVLFRTQQKAALLNNRRNATNGLAVSGSVI